MLVDFQGNFIERAALVVMHYQVDVFDILFGEQPSPLLDRCNALIRSWRSTGWPVFFPNFSLGEGYEHAPPASNRQITPYLPSGRFQTGLPVTGLAVEKGDLFYACPRASVFHGTCGDGNGQHHGKPGGRLARTEAEAVTRTTLQAATRSATRSATAYIKAWKTPSATTCTRRSESAAAPALPPRPERR